MSRWSVSSLGLIAVLSACGSRDPAPRPAPPPEPAAAAPADAAPIATDATLAEPAAPPYAPFDRTKLATDVEPCVGHDGAYLKCVARVVTGNRPKSLAFSPDGTELWVALHYDKPALAVYDTTTFALIGAVELGPYGAVELHFSIDGTKVYASQFETATVFEVDRATRTAQRKLVTGSKESKVIEVSPDGGTLWVANWAGNEVSEFDLATGKKHRALTTPGVPRGLYASRNGALYVSGFTPGRLYRFDLATGALTIASEKGSSVRHVVADEDRGRLYASDLGEAKIWVHDLTDGSTEMLAATDPKPNTIELSPDGRVIYVSTRGENNPTTYLDPGPDWGTVLAVDALTGRLLDAAVSGNQSTGLAVSPDGHLLATTDFLDNRLNIYELPRSAVLLAGTGGAAHT
ncbi:MAG TPA: YncE family protein, partial [Kofleriaceae bacterium]|nr:YncE family protein [Kofleriaceae bacterium]